MKIRIESCLAVVLCYVCWKGTSELVWSEFFASKTLERITKNSGVRRE